MKIDWEDILEGCNSLKVFNGRILYYDTSAKYKIFETMLNFLNKEYSINIVGINVCDREEGFKLLFRNDDFWKSFKNHVMLPSIRCIKGK